jgi:hypothetical protein
VTEPTDLFLLLSTLATAALVVAGTASTLWFLSLLRRLGLRLRFCSRLSRPAAVPGCRNRRLPPCGRAGEHVPLGAAPGRDLGSGSPRGG